MERKSDTQPLPITLQPVQHKLPLAVLIALMLMPWIWVSLGLTFFADYRLTITMYELLGCALPVLILRSQRERMPIFPVGLRKDFLIISLVVTNITILTVFKASNGFGMDWVYFYEQAQRVHLTIDEQFWAYAAWIVILNPLFEECFWRGIIYRQWRLRMSPWKANALSSFFFGAWHWLVLSHFCSPLWAILLSIMVMIGGVVFAYAYEKTGSLGVSLLLHGAGTDFPLIFVTHACIIYSENIGRI